MPTYLGTGAVSEAQASITPAYFSAPAAGQIAVLEVESHDTNFSIPTTPDGWLPIGTILGGSGAFGADTGQRRLTWFLRQLVGSDATPTTTIPVDANGGIAGCITQASKAAGSVWAYALALGQDTISNTAFSATCSPPLGFATDDLILGGYAVQSDAASLSAEALSATGVTFGAVTERVDAAVTTGHDARLGLVSSSVTAPPNEIVAAVFLSATLAVAGVGALGVLVLREFDSPITATVDNTLAAVRLDVDLTPVTGTGCVEIARVVVETGEQTPVRGGCCLELMNGRGVLWDTEAPLDVPVFYELSPPSGTVFISAVITATVTVVSSGFAWLKDPLNPSRNVRLNLVGPMFNVCATDPDPALAQLGVDELEPEAGVFAVHRNRHPVVSGQLRKDITTTMRIESANTAHFDRLEALLAAGTVLLLQMPDSPDYQWGSKYVHMETVVRSRGVSDMRVPSRQWNAPLIVTSAPHCSQRAGGVDGVTWQDVLDTFPTWQALLSTGGTWLDLLQGDLT